MKFYSLMLIPFLILSCNMEKDEYSYSSANLKENIKAFIDARKCFQKDINIVLVSLEPKGDTMVVSMADMYPRIKIMTFNYDTVLYGHRIIFTGEKIKGYSKKSSTNQFPPDIIEKSKNTEWPYIEEFTTWFYFYKDGKLVYKDTPCAESK